MRKLDSGFFLVLSSDYSYLKNMVNKITSMIDNFEKIEFDCSKIDSSTFQIMTSMYELKSEINQIFILNNINDLKPIYQNKLLKKLEEPKNNKFFIGLGNNNANIISTLISRSIKFEKDISDLNESLFLEDISDEHKTIISSLSIKKEEKTNDEIIYLVNNLKEIISKINELKGKEHLLKSYIDSLVLPSDDIVYLVRFIIYSLSESMDVNFSNKLKDLQELEKISRWVKNENIIKFKLFEMLK